MRFRPLLSSLTLFLLGGVGVPADSQTFPSLSRRPIESRDFDAEQRAADQKAIELEAQAPEPALLETVAKLDADAKAGASAFDAALATAGQEIAAAAGAAVTDDSYSVAQRAISRLEASRNQTVGALANLDTLYADRLLAVADGRAAGGAAAIAATRSRVVGLVDSQNDRLDALKGRLVSP